MKNFKPTIPVILGVITVAEIIFTRSLGGSLLLWLCYGLYKMA